MKEIYSCKAKSNERVIYSISKSIKNALIISTLVPNDYFAVVVKDMWAIVYRTDNTKDIDCLIDNNDLKYIATYKNKKMIHYNRTM